MGDGTTIIKYGVNNMNDVKKLYHEDGVLGIIHGIGRYFYWNFGIINIHRQIAYRTHQGNAVHTVAGTKARFRVTNYTEFVRFRNLMFEKSILEDILDNTGRDDVFYDIGANVGLYSCFVGKNTNYPVVAIEPHPSNTERLSENAELNDVDVNTIPVALSYESGTGELTVDENNSGAGQHTLAKDKTRESIKIDLETGDNIPDQYSVPQPTIMKIDVEGAELDVLRGSKDLISDCELIYCEIHPDRLLDFDAAAADVEEFFNSNGFKTIYIGNRKNEYFVKAVSTNTE